MHSNNPDSLIGLCLPHRASWHREPAPTTMRYFSISNDESKDGDAHLMRSRLRLATKRSCASAVEAGARARLGVEHRCCMRESLACAPDRLFTRFRQVRDRRSQNCHRPPPLRCPSEFMHYTCSIIAPRPTPASSSSVSVRDTRTHSSASPLTSMRP